MTTTTPPFKRSWLVAALGLLSLAWAAPLNSDLGVGPERFPIDQDETNLPQGVPRKIKMTDKPNDPAGKLVKVRYGPFSLPPNSVFTALPEAAGGVKIHKPCEECYLGAFQGGLEYEDGTDANVASGPYLHHFVIINNNKPDWVCGLRSGSMYRPQYVYNSGNERPPVRLNTKHKFGMRVDSEDTFSAAGELMNMSNETKVVYATTIYEVIPLETPGDVPAKDGSYNYTSPEWKSPYAGVMLHNDGHGHDGTTHVSLTKNGQEYCNSIQYYGLRNGTFLPKDLATQHAANHGAEMQYISDAVACEDTGRLEKGDVLQTTAHFDESKYPQMTFKGHKENQMGISFVYIGRDEDTLGDMLPVDKLGDQLPLEMGGKSAFGYVPRPAGANVTGIAAIPGFLGRDPETVTELEEPFKPLSFPRFPWGDQVNNNKSSMLGKLLSPSNPATQKTLQAMLPTLLPSLPKDFKLSEMFPPGGIVTSDVEVILSAVQKDHPDWLAGMPPKFRAPQNETVAHQENAAHGAGGHSAMIKSIYGLNSF
ncbi:hypothetical protein EG327_001675 [Venturia inaequalis]|uniref:Uncharacterized protein n=1 Tax=Venturia inaequalis TaxID=5025 RepID=A0A8H3YLZ4_VENIN|nr:hypothetical protein EG327_001675 [Venturia inaequalis]